MNPIPISVFAQDPNLLGLDLYPKQVEILESVWEEGVTKHVWALGRRSGKTLKAAIAAVYAGTILAPLYYPFLRKNEKFRIVTVANDIEQATIALQNIKDLISNSPVLSSMIVSENAKTLELNNRCVFRALTSSGRSGRGLPCPLVIFDEMAHALNTGGNSGANAIYSAMSPSVAQFGKLGRILMLSSPWISEGIFWKLFNQAKSGEFKGIRLQNYPTWEVNPTISQDFLDEEKALDPELFHIEYGANFSNSLSVFIASEIVDAAVCRNIERRPLKFLPPKPEYRGRYYLCLDPAKGNRDRYTACIVHYEGQRLVVDKWHEFRPTWLAGGEKKQVHIEEVEEWILEMHKLYGFANAALDQYNSQSTIQRLSLKMKIEELTWTVVTKTEAFTKLRNLFNSGDIELYEHEKAIAEIKGLAVVYRQSGSWDVTGGTGAAVDDYALALAGAAYIASPLITVARTLPQTKTSPWGNMRGKVKFG